ncbi:MAG: Glycoside hydrolase family 18 [Ignavibacteria bacterium]|nr:MAG: Glycoside hydrolase family 18 [Ignavibacteria bacterium]KAF0161091.1 MAG: Glycoside hydrolase family 18 [Ignavibacteria bacterium]
MKKFMLIIILFVAASTKLIYGQYNSVHQFDSENYKKYSEHASIVKNSLKQNLSASKLNKLVFGYLPYWEYHNGTHHNIRYDLLTHLAVFSFEADSLGNLKDPYGWPWSDVITKSKANNVKLILTVTNFEGNSIHSLFTNRAHRTNLFSNIVQRVKQYGFNGVNIDFENVNEADRNSVISNFFVELRNYLVLQNLNLEISFASPIINWGGWDFSMIAKNCDHIFIMGYDFYGSWSTTTGPSAPLSGGNYNLTNSLSFDYSSVIQANPEKLILGVPYYGNYWRTKSSNPYSAATSSSIIVYRDVVKNYNNKELLWDYFSNTSWIRWQDTTWNQIWFDNEASLSMKYDLAISYKIGGVGIWALGYDDGRTELWKLIESKFAKSSSTEKNYLIPTSTVLEQNYPNPFNSTTVIRFQLSAFCHVSLKVYDVLGREIAVLVDEFKQAGIHSTPFVLSSTFSSGVYLYRLQVYAHGRGGSYSETKKMVLLR